MRGTGRCGKIVRRFPLVRRMIFKTCLLLLLLLVTAVCLPVWLVHQESSARVIGDLARLPVNDVGLVLGTSKNLSGQRENLIFTHRMEAAAELFRAGRVRHLIVSGNNDRHGYNEPADMERMLVKLGVPVGAITRDDSGFRTLDSVVRAAKVFGQSHLTLVTDRFHCYRAVFLARHYGIDAVGFPSREVAWRYSIRARGRELFADVKAFLDLYVLHTQAQFLGKPVAVPGAGR